MNISTKKIYNTLRNYLKKQLTGNLGKVVEEKNKLICYVKKGKIKKDKYKCVIACFGIAEEKKLAEAFELNKSICYIIDDMEIEKNITIKKSR